jgi:hypothetical protein
MENSEKTLEIIKPYIDQNVVSELDGNLFDHVPSTFLFRFADPSELWDALMEDYEDYLEDWEKDEIIPVAAVSSKDSPNYEFAWIFLDWRDSEEPGIVITTTDDWSKNRTLSSIAELNLEIK